MVLECACGTGAISQYIAPVCKKLIATDFSISMLKKARKKCGKHGNVTFRRADITHIRCRDERFDKAVAGNVIHLKDVEITVVNGRMPCAIAVIERD